MKSIFNGRVASVLLVMLFVTMGSNPVIALDWEQRCLDPKFDDHPNCTGGEDPPPDPGDESLTLENVYGEWSGSVQDQWTGLTDYEVDGLCQASGTISQGYVAYGCPWDFEVHFTLNNGPNEALGKEKELCDQLIYDPDPEAGFPGFVIGGSNADTGFGRITAYHFTMDPTWNDGKCTEDNQEPQACLVRVRMTAYFDEWCNAKKCGRLVLIRGWGYAKPAGLVELNPFYYDQVLDIHDLEVYFKGIGTNRDVAECHWYGLDVQYNTDNPYR